MKEFRCICTNEHWINYGKKATAWKDLNDKISLHYGDDNVISYDEETFDANFALINELDEFMAVNTKLITKLLQTVRRSKFAEQDEVEQRRLLLHRMVHSCIQKLSLDDNVISVRGKHGERRKFNTAKFAKDYPKLYEEYTTTDYTEYYLHIQ